METPAPKLAIIAGGGSAPRSLIDVCQKLGRPFFVICLEGQTDHETSLNVPHAWLALGAGSKLKELVKNEAIKEMVMVGRVRRPSLLEIKPDWMALRVLTKIGMNMLGDDALLRAIGRAMEEEGQVRIIGAQEIVKDLLTPEGQLGQHAADETAEVDVKRGIEVARVLGQLDIGQSVVIQQGIVLGVEAAEGTDELIARSAHLQRAGARGILIKIAKPQQDNRYDLPTVGPDTIHALAKAGLRGVVLEAQRSLLLEREKTIALADEQGLFIIGTTLTTLDKNHG